MDDLICEIIEAFEAAQVEYEKKEGSEQFYHWLYKSWNTAAKDALNRHLVPILEKHAKPDRIEAIKTLKDAIRSLLFDESTAPSLSEQLTAGNSVECIVEIDGRRFKATLKRNED